MSTYAEDELVFFVNGKKVVEKNPDPEVTLLQYLRDTLRLTGAKLGCGEGGCGACTVMVSKYDRVKQHIYHLAVNACLTPLCSMHGLAVTTTEAIGDTKTRLHPVQERLAKSHGSQCGFCTPGMVMSMYILLRNNPCPSMADVENAFEGNLCRCTGYRPILDAFRSFTNEFQCPMGEECCKNNKTQESTVSEEPPMEEVSEFLQYDPSQEPIFPSELQLNDGLDKARMVFSSGRVTWYRPTSLDDLLTLKSTYPEAELVIGNTEAGVGWKSKSQHYPVVIAVTKVPELLFVERTATGVWLGASTTLTTLKEVLQELVSSEPEYKTRIYAAIIEMLRWFAGKQVRNTGSIGGSIMTASPISDLNPLFLSARCQVNVASKDRGQRTIVMNEEFFNGYRKTLLKPDEVLLNILIPFTRQNEYFEGYKQAHRRQDDIAIVNAGMRVLLEDKGDIIKELSLSYGGMDAHTVMVTSTAGNLVGKKWDGDLIPEACDLIAKELSLPPGVPGGMESYRNTLSLSFFFKFYLTVQTKRDSKQSEMVPLTYQSATSVFERQPGCGSQVYQEVEDKQQHIDPVGRALPHLAATQQTTGEAMFIDDIRPYIGELSMAFVISSKAHARLISVDASDALQMPGVVDFISHKDVPGENCFGFGAQDQQVFAVDKVMYQGQIIGAIVAETRTEAIWATKAVVVKYEELTPILTIQQAIDADSFLRSDPMTIRDGDVAEGFKTSDLIIEGEAYVCGQEHFYLEMQSGIAVPSGEDGEITMLMSAQFPNRIHQVVAATLGVPRNKIVCKSKRLGGGFGGKLTNTVLVASPLAVAANKLQCPVRCYLDRDDDMVITGNRYPFIGRYKVGLTKAGMVRALELDLYSNCGYASDLSVTVMERAMFHADNSYRIPNIVVRGHICKTNLPANTAMRGAGTPQSLFITEHWMEKAAQALDVSSDKLRLMNMYVEGDLTYYNQPLTNCNLSRCWEDVMRQSNYEQRQNDINVFNSENRWKKRGIAITPVKYGNAFTTFAMNQSGALLHVYTDGSVLLAHGGVEMGQGLNTKMIQIASRVLKIPMSKIHVSEYSSDKVPNASATAASVSSDLNGMAVLHACEVIMERLQPYIGNDPNGLWEVWVNAAYMDRVSLSTTGFYKTPMSDYDWQTNSGEKYNYFSYGVAVSEVQIDTLTGDHVVLRTDIVMDVGQSLNPAIDIGQIEGAFVQGYGLFVLEEVRRSPTGILYTDGPSTYKIPSFTDIPVQLNVSLLKGASNPRAVYSSKAIGEPPLFLAASVFFAIRHAIAAARADVGLNDSFQLNSPATAEKIRMACVDQFTKQFPEAEKGSYTPWVVDP